MDDLISRSALIAELEAFKMSMNDIVLRFVVDRVIDLVKNFQVKETQPAIQVQRNCNTCRYASMSCFKEPCKGCSVLNGFKNWELRE